MTVIVIFGNRSLSSFGLWFVFDDFDTKFSEISCSFIYVNNEKRDPRMMKTALMVAEKPSLAQNLATILSNGKCSTNKG